jgi:hypothetical protein
VPSAAAGLADVVAGDPDPRVAGGVGEHPLQQLPVRPLELAALAQQLLGLGDARGERVADPLQLAEAEQARLAGVRRDAVIDLDPAEALGDAPGELALEPPDLAPEVRPSAGLPAARARREHPLCLDDARHVQAQV